VTPVSGKLQAMGVLDGKAAVVTGAGQGLGRAHAVALAAAGASVLVNDVNGDAAAAVAAEIGAAGGRAVAQAADLGTMAGARSVIDAAVAAFGTVAVLVNNAGISRRQLLGDLDEAVLDRHLAVHLKATIATTQAAFPVMQAAGGGRIVNTVSGAGLRPEHPGTTSYACAKAAVYAATLVAAAEGAPLGIRVNAVSPLAVTPMSAAFFERTDAARREELSADRVAEVVVFLASELAADMTGRVLRVEGGHVREAAMVWSDGVAADHWTPETLAARLDEVLLPR
jgi:NAD(P)-dependent dehydrogenase (short-subunit alcohol dehydrogenase family)